MSKFTTHDEYLATVPADQRAALGALRKVIRSAAPDAEEYFYFGIPAYRQGKPLVGYAAMKNHCGFYVLKGTLLAQFAKELADFSTDEGTVRFAPEHPIPDTLVRSIVSARIMETK